MNQDMVGTINQLIYDEKDPSSKVDHIGFKAVDLGAVRVEQSIPMGYRMAQYPNGKKLLQGAYQWQEGIKGGIIWRDMPLVQVDELGQEIE